MKNNYIIVGKIDMEIFKNISYNLITDEVILTNERYLHIIEGHKEDFMIYSNILSQIIIEPNYILEDYKNKYTVMVIKKVENNNNINVIIRLAIGEDLIHNKNSIMTMYRIREKNLKKLMQKKTQKKITTK